MAPRFWQRDYGKIILSLKFPEEFINNHSPGVGFFMYRYAFFISLLSRRFSLQYMNIVAMTSIENA